MYEGVMNGLAGAKAWAAKKAPDISGVKHAAMGVWARFIGLFAAIGACFRRPGLSEIAAVTALAASAIGAIGAIFSKKIRRLAPLFAVLAAIGAAIVILRCFFPRRED